METRPPTLQVDSLPSEPPGKPKNTGVGSLSFLQGIILTQETNGDLCIAGAFFTRWASREVHHPSYPVLIGLVSFQAGKCELTLKYEQTIKSH